MFLAISLQGKEMYIYESPLSQEEKRQQNTKIPDNVLFFNLGQEAQNSNKFVFENGSFVKVVNCSKIRKANEDMKSLTFVRPESFPCTQRGKSVIPAVF